MRTLGLVLILAGAGGFLYASGRAAEVESPPAGISVGEAARTEAGRLELIRYGSAGAALVGIVLALFPKGR
ncbi:MAG TPA: hypothetical protein VII13_05215 [Vicinamibacteria bacterium]|jgi:hypothetical protein